MKLKFGFLLCVWVCVVGCASKADLEGALAEAAYAEGLLNFQVVRDSTRVAFSVGTTKGRFKAVDGRLSFSAPQLTAGTLEVTLASAGLDVFNPLLEQMLKGTDWFDVANYPLVRFSSQSLAQDNEQVVVAGLLQVKELTRPVELFVVFDQGAPDLANPPASIPFTAFGSFNRSEFGMDELRSFAPDLVELRIEGLLQRKDPATK